MAIFKKRGTIVCSIEVETYGTTTKVSPATSMNIVITNPINTEVVPSTAMDEDATGEFHHDYTPGSSALRGKYIVDYTATDGDRVSTGEDEFEVE